MAVPVPGSTTAAFVAVVAIGGGCGYWWCDIASIVSPHGADSKTRASLEASWNRYAAKKKSELSERVASNEVGESSVAKKLAESLPVPSNGVVGDSSIAQGTSVANDDALSAQESVDEKNDFPRAEVAHDLKEDPQNTERKLNGDEVPESSQAVGMETKAKEVRAPVTQETNIVSSAQKSADVNDDPPGEEAGHHFQQTTENSELAPPVIPQSKPVQGNGENGASASSSLVSMNDLFEIGSTHWFLRTVGLTLLIDLVALTIFCKIGRACCRGCSRNSKAHMDNGKEARVEGNTKEIDQKGGQEKNGKKPDPKRKSTGSNSKRKGGKK